MVRNGEEAHLRHEPTQHRCRRRRQEQPREPAQRRRAHSQQGRLLLALPAQPDGLQRADVPRHEGEDGHADAALDEDPEVRQLQEARRCRLGRAGGEEVAFPATGEVGGDHEEGGDAAKTLQFGGRKEGGHGQHSLLRRILFLPSTLLHCCCIIRSW